MRHATSSSRRPAAERTATTRRVLLALALLLLTASSAAFIAYTNWRSVQDTAKIEAHTNQMLAKIDSGVKQTLQKRIDDAKKAEAAAKAHDEEIKKSAPALTATEDKVCDITNGASITVVINKKHCFNPKNWAPTDLTSLDGYLMAAQAASHMDEMMQAAAAAGVGFTLSSAYRSYDNQVVTYNTWVNVNGSTASADTVSARPGYSEHQTGLAADLKAGSCALECFKGTSAYQWLRQNAATYGFIERYPDGLTEITGYSPEAWHWRYVGSKTALDMKTKGIETLEQYLGISGGDYAS
jgi:D-alanyl-D-alanine carboxypeptidase